ncbi:sex hormone-binding globulin isoform X5 [Peromyscus maniculatus bairdii]|uniref:sex hormone-binding globulin isoform X5 n=1 Tax=Peromyscus maniculatus bairdii TaxID=230844 RepID=UPI001C2EA14A|nr:sex hormone-binding globulin isoform X5 [Peromyscus maniculatus bairdii]
MENRGSVACRHRWLLQLLLLLSPPHTRQGQALGLIVLAESAQDPPARYLSNGPGQEPVSVMTIDLTKISKPLSSFEFRTLDPEGVIFYGDTNTEDDWFMLGLRDGQLEIQLYNLWARLTVGFGPQLNDGRWHQQDTVPVTELFLSLFHQMEIPRLSQYVELKMNGDSLLLWVDGKDILCLRQVSRSLADSSQTTMRIALGGLLPASRLRLPLAPALDGCIRRDTWLGHQAQLSPSAPTSLGNCDVVDLQPGLFFPAGTHAEFSLQDIPQPHTDPWSFSLELGLKLAEGSGCLLALGTGTNSSWLTLHLQDHKVVLSSGVEPNLALPLDMGLPLQLKLDVFKVVLSQGPTMEVLAVSLSGLDSLQRLWSHPQGHLSLGALPGDDSFAFFCLSALWIQGQRLDIDRALNRSQNIWTHSCPRSPNSVTQPPL